jgi:hypothetical protein
MNINRLTWFNKTLRNSEYDFILKARPTKTAPYPRLTNITVFFHIRPREVKSSTYAIRFIAILLNNYILPTRSLFKRSKTLYNQRVTSKYSNRIIYNLLPINYESNIILSFLLMNNYNNNERLKIKAKVSEKNMRLFFRKFSVFLMQKFLINQSDQDWQHKLYLVFAGMNLFAISSIFKLFPTP